MSSLDATGELASRGLSGQAAFVDFFLTLRTVSPLTLFHFRCAFGLLPLVTGLLLTEIFTESPTSAAGRGARGGRSLVGVAHLY